MRLHTRLRTVNALALLGLSACCEITGTCEKPSCDPQQRTYVHSFGTFLTNGAPVAVFQLEQDYADYPADCEETDGGPVHLRLTSSAAVPLRFDYALRGLGATGLVVWSHEGTVARLAPGQTISVGHVATTPVRVDMGAAALLFNVFPVP